MVIWCGRLFSVRTGSALDIFDILARTRAFELSAAVLYQTVRVDTVLPLWLFG